MLLGDTVYRCLMQLDIHQSSHRLDHYQPKALKIESRTALFVVWLLTLNALAKANVIIV